MQVIQSSQEDLARQVEPHFLERFSACGLKEVMVLGISVSTGECHVP